MINGNTPLAPVMGIYGRAKLGKSTQLSELCAGSGAMAIVASSSALLPAKTFLELPGLNTREAASISEVRKLVKEHGPKCKIMGIDDLTVIVKRSGKEWKVLNRDIIGLIYEDCIPIRDKYGTCFVITLHEQEERISSGKRIRGGPELPGQAPEEFSGYLDVILRAVSDETMELWPFVYHSISRPKWIAGDRLSVFPDQCPMNICEGLRLYGMNIARAPGLEWQDHMTHKLYEMLIAEPDNITNWRDIVKPIVLTAISKNPERYKLGQVKWAVRDALHRAIYQKAKSIDKWLEVPDTVMIG